MGPLFPGYQILVPYINFAWNLFFKNERQSLMKVPSKTRRVADFANGIKLCFLYY